MRVCNRNTHIAPDLPGSSNDVAIFLSEDEATELKLLLPKGCMRFSGKLKDAPLASKLYLALEMMGIGVETCCGEDDEEG